MDVTLAKSSDGGYLLICQNSNSTQELDCFGTTSIHQWIAQFRDLNV